MATRPLNSDRRIPELDGLRGIAILLVLFFHYFAAAPLPSYLSIAGRLTWSGVDLFFLLSGFLLGGILLDARESPDYFKTFYVRRAYRILPLYAVVCVLYWTIRSLLAAQSSNPAFYWLFFTNPMPWYSYATFTQNFWMAKLGTVGPAWLGATWSLAIEEQFYLILPLIIRYVNKRRLPYLLALLIIMAPITRALFRLFQLHGDAWAYVLMPSRADALMLGVGAAMLLRNAAAKKWLEQHRNVLYVCLAVLLCGMAWMALGAPGEQLQHTEPKSVVQTVRATGYQGRSLWPFLRVGLSSLNYTWIALFYLCLLLIVVTQRGSMLSRITRTRRLMSAGTIAYGAYLFHQPVLGLCFGWWRPQQPGITNYGDAGLTLLALVVTLTVAWISWSFFERPLVKRGHKCRYGSKDRRQTDRLGI